MNTQFTAKKTLATSIATLILAMSLPLASTAFAEDGHNKAKKEHCERGDKMRHGMHKPGLPPYLKAVDLTEVQKDQLFTLMHEQAPKVREQHKAQFKLMEEMRATTQADQFDEAKAKAIAAQIASLDQEKTLMRAQNEAKIFALLTPEQRKKAREFKFEKSWGERGPRGERTGYKNHRHTKHDVKS